MRAVYFKGCHLWEYWEDWTPQGQRSDDVSHVGVAQTWQHHEPGSPNFSRDIAVKTYIAPMAGTSDMDADTSLDTLLVQIEDELISLASTKGALSYAMDNRMRADVTGGPYPAAGAVSHDAVEGGWEPATGRMVLLRDPTSGAGFVATIQGIGSGTMTLAAATGETWQSVSSSWEIVYVQQVLPETTFIQMSRGSREDALAVGAHRRDVEYTFKSAAAALHATAHAVPRGNV